MNRLVWMVLVGLFGFAAYHLVRDVATEVFALHGPLFDVAHRPHAWCGPTCGWITIPLEVFNLVTIAIMLWRRRLGPLAWINLATVPLWLAAWLLP